MEKFNVLRFSKKIIIFTLGATIVYACVYMFLCFMIQQLPDYSFNAGLFAALSAENICNAWIKVQEAKHKQDKEDEADSYVPNHPNELNGEDEEAEDIGG